MRYVSPRMFADNLVAYSVSGSKMESTLKGCCSPAGSYKVLSKWFSEQGSQPCKYLTGENVLIMIKFYKRAIMQVVSPR